MSARQISQSQANQRSTSQRMRACKHQAVLWSPLRPPPPSAPRLLSPHLLLSTAAYRVHSSAQLLGVNRGLGYSVDSTDTISITALTAYCGDDTLTVGSARHVGPQRGNPTHALAGLAKPAHSPHSPRRALHTNYHTRGSLKLRAAQRGVRRYSARSPLLPPSNLPRAHHTLLRGAIHGRRARLTGSSRGRHLLQSRCPS